MEVGVFDQIAMAVEGGLPRRLGTLHVLPRRWNLKLWLDAERCPPVHYEAQVLTARHVPGAEVLGLEVGLHAEHKEEARNEEAMVAVRAAEERWRPLLGDDPVVGRFLGRATRWRRVSETWADPDLGDPDLVLEVADRLTTYVEALEPVLARTAARR